MIKANGRNEDMLATRAQQVVKLWPTVAPVVRVPSNEVDYEETVSLLDFLIDEVGEDESHPLASLMEVLGVLIEKYEDEHVPEITAL
jgi:HTH-type transcriptional regulator/antitoxin HigA